MFKGYGGIAILAILYFIAAKIGDTFSQTLTVFSIMVWAIAAALFVYLILFRGVKFTPFGMGKPAPDQNFEIDDVGDATVDDVDLVQKSDDENSRSMPS
jgi:hypothetical protein